MMDLVDLTRVSSEDLRAELDRRRRAAQAKGKPLRYATKAEWAAAQAVELRARLSDVQAESKPGHVGLRKKNDSIGALEGEIRKFDRLADKYRRLGV